MGEIQQEQELGGGDGNVARVRVEGGEGRHERGGRESRAGPGQQRSEEKVACLRGRE